MNALRSAFLTLAAFGLASGAPRFSAAATQADIEYGHPGDVALKLDAYTPDPQPLPGPIAIIVHGGGWSGGDKAKDITPLIDPLNKAGITVFSINYRMAPTYRWPDCFDDVRTAIRWAKAHAADYHADPSRVALIGYSAGGQLACLAAVTAQKEAPDTTVQAVVGLAPPTDLELDLPQRGGLSPSLQGLLNRPHEMTPDALKQLQQLSAIHFIHSGLPPFLLMHGNADKSVPYPGSLHFQKALQKEGITCDLITLPATPHNIAQWPKADPAFAQKVADWLKKTLEAAPATVPAPH